MYSPMRERRGGIGRLVWWTFWILLIVYVVGHPTEAAANARAVGAGLQSAAESIIAFVQQATGSAR